MTIRAIVFSLHFVLYIISFSGYTQNNNYSLNKSSQTTSSVLDSGDWYKIGISGAEDRTGSGIYKLDYNFLSSIGINLKEIDPRKIKLYGNGGGMLSQKNSDSRPDDLLENAIYISGETDGVFDPEDYILFYGKGPHTWTFDSVAQIFFHTVNIYSDQTFYFLTVDGKDVDGKRIADVPYSTGGTSVTIFDEHYFYEPNNLNLLSSGREWFGEIISGSAVQSYYFSTPDMLSNSSVKITSSVVGRSTKQNSFDLSLNGNKLGTQTFTLFIDTIANYGLIGDIKSKIFSFDPGTSPFTEARIDLTYNDGGLAKAMGNLNFLEINYKRPLSFPGNQLEFRSIESKKNILSEFIINNASNDLRIWNITEPTSVSNQLYGLNGASASFSVNSIQLKEFTAFTGNDFPAPAFIEKINNQNLHAIDAGNIPDLLIVTAEKFKLAAERLANFRRQHDKINVLVVDVKEIYNEFSSGAQDITAIRDFVKMIYDRDNGSGNLKYLLLFGSCSYDYKDRIQSNTNTVPTYESRESLNSVNTYSSDDYYGFLESAEGYWSESPVVNHTLEIGVGRLPVKSVFEADIVVDKLINYSSNAACLGDWRNRILFVADDGDFNGHLIDAENLSLLTKVKYPVFNINKLYIDAYPQLSTSSGDLSPVVKDLVNKEIEKGVLILNYSGHGSENVLSAEKVIEINQIASWTNYNKLPFFITATCEFGRYDDPTRPSGAELLIVSPKGGAIGLLSSTRPVYKSSNIVINTKFYEASFKKVAGQMPRLGDVMRQAKNESLISVGNRNYSLLGDPSLKLSYPQEDIIITDILTGSVPISVADSIPDTLRALSKVTIVGEVRANGNKISGFQGTAQITLFDKESRLRTLGTQESDPIYFNQSNNYIYDGASAIHDGTFKVSFVVPKDISYQYGFGKISFYAVDSTGLLDAGGQYQNIVIGGSDKNAVNDTKAPEINLFMNDTLFVSGGFVKKNSTLIVHLSDENGINIGGEGIGHEISATIDKSREEFVLNNYYTTDQNDFRKGQVLYPLQVLTKGNHSIKVKAWDTYNNSSEATIKFVVADDSKIGLHHVTNYPNPFKNTTNFQFDHSREGEDLEVSIQIFSISGQLIKTLKSVFPESQSHISGLQWDGKDEIGHKINRGIYIYKVKLRSLKDLTENFAYQKLVIIN